MSKALDARNARYRAKAGDRPYQKVFLETQKACPYCDSFLRPGSQFGRMVCDCGEWDFSWTEFNKWNYTPGESLEARTNKHSEADNG